jgi:hypothetical protein
MDGCDLISDIYTNLQGKNMISQCYMHHSLRDEHRLPNVICTNLQGMDVVSSVLYALLVKGEVISLKATTPT